MVLSNLCGILIYLIFSFIHIVVDASRGNIKKHLLSHALLFYFSSSALKYEYRIMDYSIYPIYIYTYMVSVIHFVFGHNPSDNEKVKQYLLIKFKSFSYIL